MSDLLERGLCASAAGAGLPCTWRWKRTWHQFAARARGSLHAGDARLSPASNPGHATAHGASGDPER
ncbi:MAG: hypothetical protein EA413_00735 [Cyanobium sp. PLM2.Bin73]|nr:MAG: hypothetical protein EA413_00735 [Cyanobium sp. PLM2.Bin73]